ncbi:MAG: 50S ribosomal protein L24 [Clostridia bacterium]|nr:50S ribosomal protein L24 [Clostridia bacterium]
MSLNVKKGDTVVMIAGKDKGKTGKVTACDPRSGRVVVEGCNIVTKHTKPRGANQPGGKNKMAGPVDVSNVQIICPACNKATRVANKIEGDKKLRVCHKCGASLEPKKVEKKAKKAKADKAETPVAEEAKEKKTAKKAPAKKTSKKAEAPVTESTATETTEQAENGGEN